jgi:hypothetical protein
MITLTSSRWHASTSAPRSSRSAWSLRAARGRSVVRSGESASRHRPRRRPPPRRPPTCDEGDDERRGRHRQHRPPPHHPVPDHHDRAPFADLPGVSGRRARRRRRRRRDLVLARHEQRARETRSIELTDTYNSSPRTVCVVTTRRTRSGTSRTIQTSTCSPARASRPVHGPVHSEYALQVHGGIRDRSMPIGGVHRGERATTLLRSSDRALEAIHVASGVQWSMPFNISRTRCSTTTRRSLRGGRSRHRGVAASRFEDLRATSQADRRQRRRGQFGMGPRLGHRLRRRLVHRAVVRPGRRTRTPTTTTAVTAPATEVLLSTALSVWSCSRTSSSIITDGLAVNGG